MKRLYPLLAAALLAAPAIAEDAADIAERGTAMLGQAALALSEADSTGAEISALTATVRGYETGLEALRAALRVAALEEQALRARLAPRQDALTDLIVFLQNQTRVAEALPKAHPDGALPAIRAGMVAAHMSPQLGGEVEALLNDIAAIDALITLQEASRDRLREGAREARDARLALVNAVAERRPPPPAFSTDAAAMEALINSSETLAAFADSLTRGGTAPAVDFDDWPPLVRGQRLRDFNERDAAGVRRPGWIVTTAPAALVISPAQATVRFTGEMPDGRRVALLETGPGEMLILAGLGEILVARDDIVTPGAPIALMPVEERSNDQNLIETAVSSGQPAPETLYIELRRREAPVDPDTRFAWGTEEG